MNETHPHDEPADSHESTSSAQNVELLEQMQEDAKPEMQDPKGQPSKVYALWEQIPVTVHSAEHDQAIPARITHIDASTNRAWIPYPRAGQIRSLYGWVSLSDISPVLSFSVKKDDTLRQLTAETHSAAVNSVDGKIHVTPVSGKLLTYNHEKYPAITLARQLAEKVIGATIFSRTDGVRVPVIVEYVDGEQKLLLAQYTTTKGHSHKWLPGEDFEPQIIIEKIETER